MFFTSGDITKEFLLNNNTELTALLESVNAIVKMGAGELSGAIDMTKVSACTKVFRINPEFRILRLTFHRKSASKC